MSAKWCTLTMTSFTPDSCNRARVISRRVRPDTSTRAFGRLSVRGRSRVPSPAASTIAFIVLSRRLHRDFGGQLLQTQMPHDDFDSISAVEMFCHLFRQINRSMLTAGAAERHHQVFESALLIVAQAGVHQRHYICEILMYALMLNQ